MWTIDELVHRGSQRGAHRFDVGEDLAARDGRRGDATGGEQREIANLGPGRGCGRLRGGLRRRGNRLP